MLRPYSHSMLDRLENGYTAKKRRSDHDNSTKFSRSNNGAIPPDLLEIVNTESNSRYPRACKAAGLESNPARYPASLPEFFIELLTDVGDLVLDPFTGSNVTSEIAQNLNRKWIVTELDEQYLQGPKFKFPKLPEAREISPVLEEAS